MKNYVLVQGEKEDKKTVKLNRLMVAKLYKVSKKKGYVNSFDMYIQCQKHGNDPDSYPILDLSSQCVIVKKPMFGRTPKYVEEVLTGVKIPYVEILEEDDENIFMGKNYSICTAHKELDIFVCTSNVKQSPSVEELLDYAEAHKNTHMYKEILLGCISGTKIAHENVKQEEEKQKLLVKEMRK